MSSAAKVPRIERTPEQKAEELRIREAHRLNPVREIPSDLISAADARKLLKFIAAIKREREAQGLTIEQLAERAKVDVGVLTRLEAGHSFNPTISIFIRLAAAMNKSLLMALEDTMTG